MSLEEPESGLCARISPSLLGVLGELGGLDLYVGFRPKGPTGRIQKLLGESAKMGLRPVDRLP